MRAFVVFLVLLLPQVVWAEHEQARQFVKEAVEAKLQTASFSESTLSRLLAKDEKGHPLSFIPDCPICLGVQDALKAQQAGEQDEGLPAELQADKASTRTSFLAKFVRVAVKEKLATLSSLQERVDMAAKLKAGSEEGQRQLERYQGRKVEAYKMMWSCLMCDAAARAGEDSQ